MLSNYQELLGECLYFRTQDMWNPSETILWVITHQHKDHTCFLPQPVKVNSGVSYHSAGLSQGGGCIGAFCLQPSKTNFLFTKIVTVTIYTPPHSSHTLLKAVILKIHSLFLSNLSPTLSEWRLFCVSMRRFWVLNIQWHVWLGNKPASHDTLCVFQLYALHKHTLTMSNIAVNVCVMAVF